MGQSVMVLLWVILIVVACFWEEKQKKRKPKNNFYNRACSLNEERCKDCPYEHWVIGNGVAQTSTEHILSCGRAKTMLEKCKEVV